MNLNAWSVTGKLGGKIRRKVTKGREGKEERSSLCWGNLPQYLREEQGTLGGLEGWEGGQSYFEALAYRTQWGGETRL